MKKTIFIIYIILNILIILILALCSNTVKKLDKISTDDKVDLYIINNNMKEYEFSIPIKNYIYENRLTILSKGKQSNFIPNSLSSEEFNRDWSDQDNLVYNQDSYISFNTYYLKDINDIYYLLINYSYDYYKNFTNNDLNQLFIELKTVINRKYTYKQPYYYYKYDNEYYGLKQSIYEINSKYAYEDNILCIKPASSIPFAKKGIKVEGFVLAEESKSSMDYIEVDCNLYQSIGENDYSVILGLNKISEKITNKYIAECKKIIYNKGV